MITTKSLTGICVCVFVFVCAGYMCFGGYLAVKSERKFVFIAKKMDRLSAPLTCGYTCI